MSAEVGHDLWSGAKRVDSRRARSRQVKIGASDVGTCRRRTAYVLARTPKSDDEGEKRAANLGTWIHKGALAVLASEYKAITEVKLEDDRIKSQADAYYPDDAIVEDVKTRGRFVMDSARRHGPRTAELYQVHLYADLLRAGMFQRREKRLHGPQAVLDVRVRFLCRDDGDEHVWQQPYDPEIAAEAWAWLAEVRDYSRPEFAPRDQRGPGLSAVCDSCPFRTACWGPAGAVAAQATLVHDDADVQAALAEYDAGRTMEKEGKEIKESARAKLDGSEAGRYGGWELKWTGGNPTRPKPDAEAAFALLEDAGVEIPMTTPGVSSRSIAVTAAPTCQATDEGATT